MADNTIAQAYVQILPTTDGIQGQLSSLLGGAAEQSGQDAGSSMGSGIAKGLGTAGKVVAGAFTAATTAATAAVGAIVKGTGEVAAYGDNIDKMSQKLGISAEAYQEWDAIMQHSGTSIEGMQRGMMTLQKAVETGSDAFQALGLSEQQVANMNTEQLFSAVITGLQGMEEGSERTVLAQQLLGNAAKELGPLLNTSAEETEAMRQRVHELGGVMSNEAVKAAANYQDTLQDMQTALSGLKNNMMSQFLPGISSVMSGLTELFSGNSEQGVGMITEGVNNLISGITANMPKLIEAALAIIKGIGSAIIENLPALIECGLEIIMTLADALIEALPELIPAIVDIILKIVEKLTAPETITHLIHAGIQLILGLAEGLIKAVPQLIEAAPRIIMNLVTALVENGPKILEAGWELIKMLAEGIVKAVPEAVKAGVEVVTGIKNTFDKWIEKAKEWGRHLISNFIEGLKEKWQHLKDTVKNIAGSIRDFLGFSEPAEGPLSNFHTYAPDMMKLFAQGIEDNEKLVTDQISRSFNIGVRIAQPQAAGMAAGAGAGQVINLTAVLELDGAVLARKMYRYNLDEIQRHGPSYVLA